MNQPIPTGPDLFAFADDFYGKAKSLHGFDSPEQTYYWHAAAHRATQAQTAAIVMLTEVIADAADVFHCDLPAWRERIGASWLTECRSGVIRRPQCEQRHTDDCAYVDPPPEPEHKLLLVGTRVLVSERRMENEDYPPQPWVGKIKGYDMRHTKYEIYPEIGRGQYSSASRWAFTDGRVQPHPEQPKPAPAPEPTGPRIYVQGGSGVQGYIVGTETGERGPRIKVHWLEPGGPETWVSPASFGVITPEEVDRCPSGQDGEECSSGEDQCEMCRQAEDDEGDMIEESMGL